MSRFDVVKGRGALFVVIESDLLSPDPAVVVNPLLFAAPSPQQAIGSAIPTNSGRSPVAPR